jgi:hypothetical protein
MLKGEEMINKKKVVTEETESVECDVCHQTYDCKEEIYETQEFLHINFTGGYESVFGDMNKVECDICQHCLKRLLGEYLRIDDGY